MAVLRRWLALLYHTYHPNNPMPPTTRVYSIFKLSEKVPNACLHHAQSRKKLGAQVTAHISYSLKEVILTTMQAFRDSTFIQVQLCQKST